MALYKNIKTWSDIEKEQVNKKMFGGFDINSSSFAAIQPTFKRNNESSAKENSSIIHFTTDGNIIMNGQLFGGGAVDLNLSYASYHGLSDVKYDIIENTLIDHFANNRNENQSPFGFYRYDAFSVAPAAVIYTRAGVGEHGIFEFATDTSNGSPVPRISFRAYHQSSWHTESPLVLFSNINVVTPAPNAGIRYELKFGNMVQSYFDIPCVENTEDGYGLMPQEQYFAVSQGIMNNLTSTIEAGKLKLKYQLLQGSTGPYKELTILNQADSTHDGYISQEQFKHLDKTYLDVIHIQDNLIPKVDKIGLTVDKLVTEIPEQIQYTNTRLNYLIGSVKMLENDVSWQDDMIKQTLVPGLVTVKDKVRVLDSTVSSIKISLTNVQAQADKSYTTATDAKTKADNAYTIAYTSMNSAYSYMSSAYSYMKSAEAAKTAAIAASDSSKKSSSAALASANTASGHASSASSSANSALAAKTAAETAKTAAIAASDSSKKSANAAAASANTASSHASSASSSANSALAAKTAAETAKTAAETAKTAAVAAKDSSVRSSNSAKVCLDCTKKIRDDVNTGLTAVNNKIKTVSDLVGQRDNLDNPRLSITEYIGSNINWSTSGWNISIAGAIGSPDYIDDLEYQSLTYYIGRVLNRHNNRAWQNEDNVWDAIGSLPYQNYSNVSDAIKDIHSVLKYGVIGNLKMDPVGSGYDIYYDIYYNKNFSDPDAARPTQGTFPNPSETTTTTYPTTQYATTPYPTTPYTTTPYPTTTAVPKQSQNTLIRMSGPDTGTIREVLSEVHGTSKSVTANNYSAYTEYTYDPDVVRRKLRIPWYGEDPTKPGVVSEHDVELTVNKVNNISDTWRNWPIGSILGTRWPVSQQHGSVDSDFIALGDNISQKLYKLTERLVSVDSTLMNVRELAYIRKSTDRSKGILEYVQLSVKDQSSTAEHVDLPDADQQYHGLMPVSYVNMLHTINKSYLYNVISTANGPGDTQIMTFQYNNGINGAINIRAASYSVATGLMTKDQVWQLHESLNGITCSFEGNNTYKLTATRTQGGSTVIKLPNVNMNTVGLMTPSYLGVLYNSIYSMDGERGSSYFKLNVQRHGGGTTPPVTIYTANTSFAGLMSPDHYKQLMRSVYDIQANFDDYNNLYFRLLTHGDDIGETSPAPLTIPAATSSNPGIMTAAHVQAISTLQSGYETINKKISSFVPYSDLLTYLNNKQDKIDRYINNITVGYDSDSMWLAYTYDGSDGSNTLTVSFPYATSSRCGIVNPDLYNRIYNTYTKAEIDSYLSGFVKYCDLPTYLDNKQDKINRYINNITVGYNSGSMWLSYTYDGSDGSNTLTASFPYATSSRCGIVNPDLYNRIYNTYTKAEIDSYLSGKQDVGNYLTKVEASVQNGKQKVWFYHSGGSHGMDVNITDASTTQNGFMTANHVTTLNNLVSKTSNMFSKSEVTDLVNKETVSLANSLRGNMVALYFHGLDKDGVYDLTHASTTVAGQVWFGRVRDAAGTRWTFYVWANGAAYSDGNNLTIPLQYENPGTLRNYFNHSLFTDGKSLYTWGKNKSDLIKIGEVPDTYLKTISESHDTGNVRINYTNSAGADTYIIIPTASPYNAGTMSSDMYEKLKNVYSKDSTYSASKIDSLVSNCLKVSTLYEIYKQANMVHASEGTSSFIPPHCFIYNIKGKQDTTIELQYSDRMTFDHVDIYCTMPIGHATIKSRIPIYYRDQYSGSRKSTKSLNMSFGTACRLMYYRDSSEAYWTMFNLIADPTVGPM